ncbi:MAG: NADH-quinone oxidoreductase subunit NuoK [Proteobacteria bacterium]|jgi:NADH-quinone oxidoreductase subunit K|nr:NADH-quinone oxidoreductase subunit NuoK [Pseudomonadota bacterium]
MSHLLVLVPSIYLFCLGLFGIYHRRHNIIMVLLSIEIMLLSVSISFVGFSCILKDLDGQIFSLFVLTTSAAEAAVGLAIVLLYYRNRGSIFLSDMNQLKG